MFELQMKLNRLAKESEREMREMGFATQLETKSGNKKHFNYTISNAKSRLGQCCNKKDINISKWLLEYATDKEIKNVLIHELIHTFEDTKGHDRKWQMYASIINNYGKYNITTTESIKKILTNNGVKNEDIKDILDYRYEITCKKCGAIYYKRKMLSRVINNYKKGIRYHKSCKGNDFIVKDLKNNAIIVNGLNEIDRRLEEAFKKYEKR